ncbi:MAG: nicotinate phosphoribosyltransferase [Actinomycetota bacterium]
MDHTEVLAATPSPAVDDAPSTQAALGLSTDLYELRMAASYGKRGMVGSATFSLFVRRLPPGRRFLVAAGLDLALRGLEQFRFDDEQLAWLGGVGFDREALAVLAETSFDGDVWAVPEGTVVFAGEPLIEVTASLPVAQLVETLVLNQITYQTAIASKAARCRLAAVGQGRLVDFSVRRTHGLEAGLAAARASAIAGFAGTSNTEAARRFGLEVVGTMAHSYVEAFPSEQAAFAGLLEDFPDQATLLVDTYDTEVGLDRAIAAIRATGRTSERGRGSGVRLDSGDLGRLARLVRGRLDAAGLAEAAIVVSSSLDEYEIARLVADRAPIDVFGVGTRMGVSADAPSLDSVYNLVEYEGRPIMKLSPGKETTPGPKQVHRFTDLRRDLLAQRAEPTPAGATPLLEPVMAAGRRIGPGVGSPAEIVAAAMARFDAQLDALPDQFRSLEPGLAYRVELSEALTELTRSTRQRLTEAALGP